MNSNMDHQTSSLLQLNFSASMASAIRTIGGLSVTMARIVGVLMIILAIYNVVQPKSVGKTIVFAVFVTGCCFAVLAIVSECVQAFRGILFQIERTRIALPPLKIFMTSSSSGENEMTGSKDNCVICLEEFKNGDLVQPFPMCNHEFHAPCINTWLNGGRITCPICRFSLQEIVVVERITV